MPFDAAKLAADVEAFCQEVRPAEELALRRAQVQRSGRAARQEVQPARHQPEAGVRRPRRRRGQLPQGARPHRPRGHRRPHVLLRPPLASARTRFRRGAATRSRRSTSRPPCAGEKILAFGLTEPDAGSNPREMTTTFEKKGDQLRPQRREVPHLERRHRRRDHRLRLPGRPFGERPEAAHLGVRRRYQREGLRGRELRAERQDGHADVQHRDVRDARRGRAGREPARRPRATASASRWARSSAAGSASRPGASA